MLTISERFGNIDSYGKAILFLFYFMYFFEFCLSSSKGTCWLIVFFIFSEAGVYVRWLKVREFRLDVSLI